MKSPSIIFDIEDVLLLSKMKTHIAKVVLNGVMNIKYLDLRQNNPKMPPVEKVSTNETILYLQVSRSPS